MKALVRSFAMLALATSAYAVPVLIISDGSSTLTISSFTVITTGNYLERTTFTGSLGNWSLNITGDVFGYGSPPGPLSFPKMSLSVDATSIGAGTLSVSFSENNFQGFGASGIRVTTIGNVAPGGSLVDSAYKSGSNFPFAQTDTLASFGPISGGAFNQNGGNGYILTGLYSLTENVQITHGSGTSHTTASISVVVPDGGSSLFLFVFGIAGVAAFTPVTSRALPHTR